MSFFQGTAPVQDNTLDSYYDVDDSILDAQAEDADKDEEDADEATKDDADEDEAEASKGGEDDDQNDEESETDDTQTHTPMFSDAQQGKINEIVQSRLDRQERTTLTKLYEAAGVELDGMPEIERAAKLWGLLKHNPDLSAKIDHVINQEMQARRVNQPQYARKSDEREVELSKREALLNLKSSDKAFAKYEKAVMTWAEQEGFSITDEKSLKHAYMAWKGVNADKFVATKQKAQEKKAEQKQVVKQKAKVQSGKSKKGSANVNYGKMSDRDILAQEGMSLFVDD